MIGDAERLGEVCRQVGLGWRAAHQPNDATTRRDQVEQLGEPPGSQPREVEEERLRVARVLREAVLDQRLPARAPAVCRPGRGHDQRDVLAAEHLVESLPVRLARAVEVLAGDQERRDAALPRGRDDVVQRLPALRAQRPRDAGSDQIDVPALGERGQQRTDQVVVARRPPVPRRGYQTSGWSAYAAFQLAWSDVVPDLCSPAWRMIRTAEP